MPAPYTQILTGDCREILPTLQADSVDCIVTSPPYWGLRNYKHPNQIGNEETSQAYVDTMAAVFDELIRILKPEGTAWLNLGDTYNAYNGGAGPGWSKNQAQNTERQAVPTGYGLRDKSLKPKELIGIPFRVAFALQARGWYLRQDIIWDKPNPMPESIKDRCTKSHEYLFLLTKSDRYYFDHQANQEKAVGTSGGSSFGKQTIDVEGTKAQSRTYERPAYETRNRRSVWTVPVSTFKGAHFATFPPDLIRPCIAAGCPEGGLVLDPFFGSGTTGEVANSLGRHCLGIELNPDYVQVAKKHRFSQPALL